MIESRVLEKLLIEIGQESNITYQMYSDNWIIVIHQGDKKSVMFSYDWPINNVTAQLVAKDKNATYELLRASNIPCFEHILFQNPRSLEYLPQNGNWKAMSRFIKKYKFPIIVKSNNGSGGNDVFLANKITELESLVHKLFQVHRNICLSPFYKYEYEYRVIILNGKPLLIYRKVRPYVIGDGKTDLINLMKSNKLDLSLIDTERLNITELLRIPADKERILLSWKHNLGMGAAAEIVKDRDLEEKLGKLALKAANAINISFASIDIAELDSTYKVVEINSGIMMEKFAMLSTENYLIAKNIYKEALRALGFNVI